MYTAAQVVTMIKEWQAQGLSKSEIAVKTAEACIGWSYVWGGYGQYCTPANRESYANRSTCPSGEAKAIRKNCPDLSGTGGCAKCKWHPGGQTRFFDCRGFTRWVLGIVEISLQGAGATSQWNTSGNWIEKGEIKNIPDRVCCVFIQMGTTMEHTGLYVGGGYVIHCSGTVKKELLSKGKWTHYAVPKGLDGNMAPSEPKNSYVTLRRGNSGEYVTLLQTKLIMLGYDLGSYGADGKFGAKTQEAVKKFQADRGLKVDGVAGADTWTALESGAVPDVLYTVRIPHLHKTDADELAAKYSGSTIEKE